MPNTSQSKSHSTKHEELLSTHPLFQPSQWVEHDLPPRHASLESNLYQEDGRLVALSKQYRWQGLIRFTLCTVGVLLAGLALWEAAYPVMELDSRGVIAIAAALGGYWVLAVLATPKANACQSGILPEAGIVESLYGDIPTKVALNGLAQLEIKTLTGMRWEISDAINSEDSDVIAFIKKQKQRHIRERLAAIKAGDQRSQERKEELVRDEIREANDLAAHYLMGKTAQGEVVWIAKSEDISELLAIAAYLRPYTQVGDVIKHEALGGSIHDKVEFHANDTKWTFERPIDPLSIIFLLTIIGVTAFWLFANQEAWSWVHMPGITVGLSTITLLAALLPVLVRLIGQLYKPRVWRQVAIQPERKAIDYNTLKMITLGLVMMTTYLGVRHIPLPQLNEYALIVLLFVALIAVLARRAVLTTITHGVKYLLAWIEKRETERHAQGNLSVSRTSQAAFVLLVLCITIVISLFSLMMMSAPVSGSGGKTSIPIYFDLLPLIAMLVGLHHTLVTLLKVRTAYIISAILTLLVIYVALALTALPILTALPLLVVIFYISLNVLAATYS